MCPSSERGGTTAVTGAAGAVTVSERKKRRAPRNALIVVGIGLRIHWRESAVLILLRRLLSVPSGRAAGGGDERWRRGRLTDAPMWSRIWRIAGVSVRKAMIRIGAPQDGIVVS
jgi:hypothetical protein